MQARLIALVLVMIAAAPVLGQAEKAASAKSFPVSLNPLEVREFADLNIHLNDLDLTGTRVSGIPLACEPGITGMMLVGDGKFQFSPKDADAIEGNFRAAMLRFNPKDQEALLPLGKNTPAADHAVHEISRQLLKQSMNRCWHSGAEALIPDEGTLAVVVYSREHGELLISTGKTTTVVFNFTTKKKLYESKGR